MNRLNLAIFQYYLKQTPVLAGMDLLHWLFRQFSGGPPIMGECKIVIYTPPFLASGPLGVSNESI